MVVSLLALISTALAAPEMIPLQDNALLDRAAPTFELKTLDGAPFRLEDHRGKPVVLSFWASWCGPCRIELPELDKLAEARSDIEVFAVNVDREPAKAHRFLEQIHVEMPVIWDSESMLLGQYDVTSMPTMFLLDANLTVKFRKVGFSREKGFAELEAALKEVTGR